MRLLSLLKKTKDDTGSITIEFIGMIPIILIMFTILWQFLIGAYAVMIAQTSVNEAAKIYSTTGSKFEAESAAKKIVGATGDDIHFSSLSIAGGPNFDAAVTLKLDLIFFPEKIFGELQPFHITQKVSGRVIH